MRRSLVPPVWLSGADMQNGTATFKSRGFWQSRMDLALSNGPWSEVRDSLTSAPAGTWAGADGVQHTSVEHNCWTEANWFFPPLSSLAAALTDPTIVLSYVGAETHNGLSVQHLRAVRTFAGVGATSLSVFQKLSATDVYLDAYTFVPDAIAFNAHPDNDEGRNIPVEIRFGNYQAVSGVLVPMRIQKVFNSALLLDVTVTSAQFNTGLPATSF